MYVSENRRRIEAAFKALEERGIIARADFWCCTGCASYAIAEEGLRENWTGPVPPFGGVYFHEQATDSANEGRDLFLGHGAFGAGGVAGQRVAELTCEVLREHGFEVTWDGDLDRKISVAAPNGGWELNYERPALDYYNEFEES